MTQPEITEEEFYTFPENERNNRTLEGVAYYASVHKPNLSAKKNFGGDPYFAVNLGLDQEDQLEKAKSWGLPIKDATEIIPHPHVLIKRVVRDETNELKYRPDVLDSMQKPIPDSIMIGNGSRVFTKFGTWYNDKGAHQGVKTALYKVQVLELVPYERSYSDPDLKQEEGGFTVTDEMVVAANETAANEGEAPFDVDAAFDDPIFDE